MKHEPFDPGITQSYDGATSRIVNRDGSFNVRRQGVRVHDFHLYQFLISLSWPLFMAVVLVTFLVVNIVFTALYVAAGLSGLQGAASPTPGLTLVNAFFFSVQTLTTVGYGVIAPRTVGTNAIAGVEALMGVMGFAFGAGLLYGRFARPTPRILFSRAAIIAPYRDGASLQFRIANRRRSALVDLEATVVLMTVEGSGPPARRTYAKLELERPDIYFLPLTWTIVHPIDEASPLRGMTAATAAARSLEILVIVRGFDDTFNQVVNARSSYRADEIHWGYTFVTAFHHDAGGRLVLDLSKIDAVREAPLRTR